MWQGAGVAIGVLLAERWGLTVERVEVLTGGMNSRAWLVVADGIELVVKSVDQADTAFEFGLGLAARLEAAGITTGVEQLGDFEQFMPQDGERDGAGRQHRDQEPQIDDQSRGPRAQPAAGWSRRIGTPSAARIS